MVKEKSDVTMASDQSREEFLHYVTSLVLRKKGLFLMFSLLEELLLTQVNQVT